MLNYLRKMQVGLNQNNLAEYYLVLDQESEVLPKIFLNSLIGKTICLEFSGVIKCIYCQRITKTSYSQGYCYNCARTLARCDLCVLQPKNCHYHLGTCREPEWGQANCFIEHVVYLANTSGIKVGISKNIPGRWLDQGAIQALPIISTKSRYTAGLIEAMFAKEIAEKTNWRKMLSFDVAPIDLIKTKDFLLNKYLNYLNNLNNQDLNNIKIINNNIITEINYPHDFTGFTEYKHKINLNNLSKSKKITGKLLAIKGQYLIFPEGIVNIRNFTGYEIIVDFLDKCNTMLYI